MGRGLKLISKEYKLIFFSIVVFKIYIVISLISEFIIGRKIKAILAYTFLLISILIAFRTLIYLMRRDKINYLKLLISSFPILYILILIFLSIK